MGHARALAAGLGLGIVGHETASPTFARIGQWVGPVGNLWVSALQLTVLPLVVTNLLAAISGAIVKSVGQLAVRTFLLFLIMLLGSANINSVDLAPMKCLTRTTSRTILVLPKALEATPPLRGITPTAQIW